MNTPRAGMNLGRAHLPKRARREVLDLREVHNLQEDVNFAGGQGAKVGPGRGERGLVVASIQRGITRAERREHGTIAVAGLVQ